jgi:hypothetical protein
MWPVSFKQAQRKMKEYRKKSKNTEAENSEEVPLPPCPNSPRTYYEYEQALTDLEIKLQNVLSSPSKARHKSIMRATKTYLTQGAIYKVEIKQIQVQAHLSFQKKLIV